MVRYDNIGNVHGTCIITGSCSMISVAMQQDGSARIAWLLAPMCLVASPRHLVLSG